VLPGSSKGFLTDPRVFNAQFYRKFYPQLTLPDQTMTPRSASGQARAPRPAAGATYNSTGCSMESLNAVERRRLTSNLNRLRTASLPRLRIVNVLHSNSTVRDQSDIVIGSEIG
jgi:hypothetical protein